MNKVLMVTLLSIVVLNSFLVSAYGSERCNPSDFKRTLPLIQCQVKGLQAEKLELIEQSNNDSSKYVRQWASARVALTELKITRRNNLMSRMKRGSVNDIQAIDIVLDFLEQENAELNELNRLSLEGALLSYPSNPSVTPSEKKQDIDVSCSTEYNWSRGKDEMRCRSN